jgi:hypothetical protein
VKYQRTESFKRDFQRLASGEKEQFKECILGSFAPAAETHVSNPGQSAWPGRLRVKDVEGAPGVWEMTWSFTDPDGRATFEWVEIEGETGVRWRRVGSHAIFNDP